MDKNHSTYSNASNSESTMAAVKDDEPASSEAVDESSSLIEEALTENKELKPMTHSGIPDDWSIVGSKGLDNEGSDGESVEVIPCEEEKSEDSASADGLAPPDAASLLEATSPNELATQTPENIMTPEVSSLLRIIHYHPAVMVIIFIIHVLMNLGVMDTKFPDLRKEALTSLIRPGLVDVIEDWKEMSSRSSDEKARIINFLKNHFPLQTFDDEIVALLEKDLVPDSFLSPCQKRRYSPYPPPPVQHKTTKPPPPPPGRASADEPSVKHPPPIDNNSENACSNCKKYSSDCKKICKNKKGKGLKYYYDKIIAPVVKKLPNLKNKF